MSLTSMHGGPDALGIPRWDFSTNANACGPEPTAWQAVQQADTTRYPDPGYAALRRRLSQWHGVEPQRIVLAASASEFIQRMSLAIAQRSPGAAVHLPSPGYGDYARAARAHGLEIVSTPCSAALVWHTEPGNPCGDSTALPEASRHAVVVVDRAYAGLRLDGEAPDWPGSAWQLWSPNKSLGLTGVRAAYAVAPRHAESLCEHLERLAPSWPLGAHGVALLDAWVQAPAQAWLHGSLVRLRGWKAQQRCMLETLGWTCRDSVVPFFVARWNADADPATLLPRLRDHGIKLRDARSLGLPGWVRLSVQAPEAQHALRVAWQQIGPR